MCMPCSGCQVAARARLLERPDGARPALLAEPWHGACKAPGHGRRLPASRDPPRRPRFAWEEAKIALLRLCQRFTFELEPGQVRRAAALGAAGPLCVQAWHGGLQRSHVPAGGACARMCMVAGCWCWRGAGCLG